MLYYQTIYYQPITEELRDAQAHPEKSEQDKYIERAEAIAP